MTEWVRTDGDVEATRRHRDGAGLRRPDQARLTTTGERRCDTCARCARLVLAFGGHRDHVSSSHPPRRRPALASTSRQSPLRHPASCWWPGGCSTTTPAAPRSAITSTSVVQAPVTRARRGYDRGLAAAPTRRRRGRLRPPGRRPEPRLPRHARQVPVHGAQPVYIFAINAGGTPGSNALLWSGTVTIADPTPDTSITQRPSGGTGTNRDVTFAFAATEPSTLRVPLGRGRRGMPVHQSAHRHRRRRAGHTVLRRRHRPRGRSGPEPRVVDLHGRGSWPPPSREVDRSGTSRSTTPLSLSGRRCGRRRRCGSTSVPISTRRTTASLSPAAPTARSGAPVRRTQTLGARDVSIIDLPRGTYRVVVPRQHEMDGSARGGQAEA